MTNQLVQVGMLGPFEVRTDDGLFADVPGARLRALLVALAPEPGRVVLTEMGHFTVRVPGNLNAHYRLGFYDRRAVSDIILSRSDQACAE